MSTPKRQRRLDTLAAPVRPVPFTATLHRRMRVGPSVSLPILNRHGLLRHQVVAATNEDLLTASPTNVIEFDAMGRTMDSANRAPTPAAFKIALSKSMSSLSPALPPIERRRNNWWRAGDPSMFKDSHTIYGGHDYKEHRPHVDPKYLSHVKPVEEVLKEARERRRRLKALESPTRRELKAKSSRFDLADGDGSGSLGIQEFEKLIAMQLGSQRRASKKLVKGRKPKFSLPMPSQAMIEDWCVPLLSAPLASTAHNVCIRLSLTCAAGSIYAMPTMTATSPSPSSSRSLFARRWRARSTATACFRTS